MRDGRGAQTGCVGVEEGGEAVQEAIESAVCGRGFRGRGGGIWTGLGFGGMRSGERRGQVDAGWRAEVKARRHWVTFVGLGVKVCD